ncbi:hypothetical protein QCA50_017072 [Cerrena zonata]|uniref:Uncharacterized protein n=1 Tax=Cerrena zonata TaxID=2478898 RepID=A0AAW0FE44_9APHY
MSTANDVPKEEDPEVSSKRKIKQLDPLAITESLGLQTYRKDTRLPWSKEEDAQLMRAIRELYPEEELKNIRPESIEWDAVSEKIGSDGIRKAKDCRKRWCHSLDPSLRRGKWTPEEDELLIQAHQKYGPSWQKVSIEIKGRTDDQCAKRYLEVLDPSTKDRLRPWTYDEDLLLIRQIKIHGTKWRTIAGEISGRPSLTCRNRWRKIVTDVVRGKANPLVTREVDLITNGSLDSKVLQQNIEDSHAKEMLKKKKIIKAQQKSQLKKKKNPAPPKEQPKPDEPTHSLPSAPIPYQPAKRLIPPSAITRPVTSETTWKYSLGSEQDNLLVQS